MGIFVVWLEIFNKAIDYIIDFFYFFIDSLIISH